MLRAKFCQGCGKNTDSNSVSCPSCAIALPTRGEYPAGHRLADESLPVQNNSDVFNYCPGCGSKAESPNKPCRICGFYFEYAGAQEVVAQVPATAASPRRFCGYCGAASASDNKFCMSCGKELADVVEKPEITSSSQIHQNGVVVSNAYVWLIVFAPLIFLAIDLIMGTSSNYAVSFFIAFGLNTWFVIADSSRLEKQGFKVNRLIGFFLVPVYLFQRAKLVGQTQVSLILWVLVFIVSSALPNLGLQPMDTAPIEDSISSDLGGATVSCPDTVTAIPGSKFECLTDDGITSAIVDVTVQGADGTVIWQVRQ